MTERTREQRMTTALHEAGHAVVHLHFGLPVTEVSIVEAHDGCGAMIHPEALMADAPPRKRRAIARQLILGCYAGLHAERFADPDVDASHGTHDEAEAFELSRKYGVLPRRTSAIGDQEHMAYLGRLSEESRRLVNRRDAPIIVLASELLARGKMSGDECLAALPGF